MKIKIKLMKMNIQTFQIFFWLQKKDLDLGQGQKDQLKVQILEE